MEVLGLVLPVLFLAVTAGMGKVQDLRHERSLHRREAGLGGFVVTDLARLPGRPEPALGTLVLGEVVVASDYGKQFVARLRTVVGGEVRSYRRLIDRARREALLRAVEHARSQGATAIVNARFETSLIADHAAEVLCFGTGVRD
jgi:uncharacterized protein YbjQ (UPF0145 family)